MISESDASMGCSDSSAFIDEDEREEFVSDSTGEENVKPSKKKSKVSANEPPAKSTARPGPGPVLATKTNTSKTSDEAKPKNKTIEETYQKKSQLEHILLRPDTYIGSVERVTQTMLVLDSGRLKERVITYAPGLYKIFDEIVVNAADNKQRDPEAMDRLEIEIDAENNAISVLNNGRGIPVVIHSEENLYVPTMIFGHLLTGSNFDDDEKRTTGGRNGYGAKLANVFSTEFIVECVDCERGLKFRQVFRKNMTVHEDPKIKPITVPEKKKGDYVKITFSPDLARFGMTRLDTDTVSLLSKRAYDVAGTLANRGGKLNVKLNGDKVPIKTFKDYLELIEGMKPPVAYEKIGDWEVACGVSEDQSFHQISFVNSICTSKGGHHVTYIADQVATHLVALIKKKNKGGHEVKSNQIKNHLAIFVNCLIENPTFDSQTKENMTSRPKAFGSVCKLSEKFLKAVGKSEIVDSILHWSMQKQADVLRKKGGVKRSKLTGIPKLDDANYAGTAKSADCTLIVTEGDSAKSLVMSGLSVVGRDYYGVFPLRGKLLNVRDAPFKAITQNEEIKHVVDIIGLKFGTQYNESNIKTLRYGHLMIMTDQDSDGSHIKGLVINFLHHFWPGLLEVPGFLKQFITPIVKVTKGKKSRTFFTLPQYEEWLESTGNHGKGYTIKYYKGLGTSTAVEAKEYFSNLELHQIDFARLSIDEAPRSQGQGQLDEVLPDQTQSASDLIDMVFRKSRVEDRKEWLNSFVNGTFMDYSAASRQGVKYRDFINKEYILFSKYDNERSIPNVIDGLKTSQRKVLFGCIKRKLKGEIKVAQIAGYIAEHSAYHHGEQSLMSTIVNMAQNFCGSNNINLLTPSGQFGTRRLGGKDSASPRYIFTKLEPIARAIFHPDDDELLEYRNEDGTLIEPEFYVPVIPMILVNGAEGIGTGWSTNVNNYNPRDIVANIRRMIAGEDCLPMLPYFSGFTGEIIEEEGRRSGSLLVKGKIERTSETTISITELPIRKWTYDYKVFLEGMLNGDEKKKAEIKDFKENHGENTVSFTVVAEKEKIDEFELEKDGLLGKFKLSSTLSTTNMTLFDREGRIVRYPTTNDIMKTFFDIRIDFYRRRKDLLVGNLRTEQKTLSNKARFVEEVCSGIVVVNNRKRDDILNQLRERGYDPLDKESKKSESQGTDEDEDSVETESITNLSKGYDYLLGMKIWSLTFEKAEELRSQLAIKTLELENLQQMSPSKIWENDLDAIEKALDDRDTALLEAAAEENKTQKKNKKRQTQQTKSKAKGKSAKKTVDWDSDEVSSDDDDLSIESDDGESFAEVATSKARVVAKPRAIAMPNARKAPNFPSRVVPVAPAKPTSVFAAPVATQVPKDPFGSDDDEDSLGESLIDRLKKKTSVPPPKKSKELVPNNKASAIDNGADDDLLFVPSALGNAPGIAAKKAQARPRSKPAKTKTNQNKGALKEKTKKTGISKVKASRKVVDLVDSESDDSGMDVNSESEEDVKLVSVSAPTRARSGRAIKKVNYTMSSEEDDEEAGSASD